MREVRLLQVAAQIRILASAFFADQAVRFSDRNAQVDNQVFGGQCIDPIFELLEPGEKLGALFRGHA